MSKRTLVLAAGLLIAALLPAANAHADGEVFLVAGLRGANEVGAPGDQDASSTVALKISGNQVSFAIRWDKLDAPTAGHIHLGARGVEGGVQIQLIEGRLPANALGVTGTVTASQTVVDQLVAAPENFYANLHNAAFSSGAVRGQLHRLGKAIDLNGVLHGGEQATLAALADGAQVPGGGDKDGSATWWIKPRLSSVAFTATWQGVSAPTRADLVKGYAVANLFSASGGLQPHLTGLAGEAKLDNNAPQVTGSDVTLSTTEFPAGAVRGSLSGDPFIHPRALTAPVVKGAQIYSCTSNVFTQFDVTAVLRNGIKHSFVQPVIGPPQWVAPDTSAVRVASLVGRFDNGAGNIPELVLNVDQSGASSGLLAHAGTVLRLNTVGGVAPAGPCTEGAKAFSPYKADYLFLG